jgi:hypothetical protein
VALAQEFMPDDVAEEGDPIDRPSNPRGRQSEEGRLARMVRELHELEDDIAAKLTAAERLLVQLESRRIHEDGGYASRAEFEDRMMASTPVLRAMREAVPPSPAPSAKLSVAKRDPADARARQTRALTAIARALERLRAIDGEIFQCATAARSTLCTIEGMRIFDECGYVSFEEFLERALGPSPILASVMALVAAAPPAATAEEKSEAPPPAEEASEDVRSPVDDFVASPFPESESTAFFEQPPPFAPSDDGEPAADPIAEAPGASDGLEASEAMSSTGSARSRRRLGGIVVSLILCAAATVAGAAAGVWTGVVARAHTIGEPTADASVAGHPSATSEAAEPSRKNPHAEKDRAAEP